MNRKMKCPQCGELRVTTINENMVCLSCGYQEYLYDYDNAFDIGYQADPTPPKVINITSYQDTELRKELGILKEKLAKHLTGKKDTYVIKE